MDEIQAGARAFLRQEYTWVAGFVVIMAVLIPVITGVALSFVSYLLGAVVVRGRGLRGHDRGHHGQRPHDPRGPSTARPRPCLWPSGAAR